MNNENIDVMYNVEHSKAYAAVREHRKTCPFWNNHRTSTLVTDPKEKQKAIGICFDCFGGGLTRFHEKLIAEDQAKANKLNNGRGTIYLVDVLVDDKYGKWIEVSGNRKYLKSKKQKGQKIYSAIIRLNRDVTKMRSG